LFGITISSRRFGTCKENYGREWHNQGTRRIFKIAGITLERIWVQRGIPGSGAPDLEIVSIETDDFKKMLKEYATSNHPWAIKFRKLVSEAFGIDLSAGPPPPLNEIIADWSKSS